MSDQNAFSLIDFAASYLQSHPRTRFILVGEGELNAKVQQQAERLGIRNRLLCVGTRDAGYWMEKMDVLMHLSQYEALPDVLVEAQMVGLPVVSIPGGGQQNVSSKVCQGISWMMRKILILIRPVTMPTN